MTKDPQHIDDNSSNLGEDRAMDKAIFRAVAIQETSRLEYVIETEKINYKKSIVRRNRIIITSVIAIILSALGFYILLAKEKNNVSLTEKTKKAASQKVEGNTETTPFVGDTTTEEIEIVVEKTLSKPIEVISKKKTETKPKQTTINEGDKKIIPEAEKESVVMVVPITIPSPAPSKNETLAMKPKDCTDTKIKVIYNIHQTCETAKVGSIDITKISGGEAPYQKKTINDRNEELSLTMLPIGNYILEIKDKNNCKHQEQIQIKEKNCPLVYDFNPDYDEIWSEIEAAKNGKITIYKNNVLVHTTDFQADEMITWDAKNKEGEILYGYFVFWIEYEDASTTKGSITVTH